MEQTLEDKSQHMIIYFIAFRGSGSGSRKDSHEWLNERTIEQTTETMPLAPKTIATATLRRPVELQAYENRFRHFQILLHNGIHRETLSLTFVISMCARYCLAEAHKYQLRVYLFQGRDLLPSDPDGLSGE